MNGQMEELRRKSLAFTVGGIIALILGMVTFIFLGPFSVVLILAGIISLVYGSGQKSKYALIYKREVVEAALRGVFDNLYFDPENGFDKSVIGDTGMMEMGNRYQSDDYISGTYNGVNFERSDILIQNVQSSGKTTTVITYFEGPWMIFDFPKPFRCDLQVSERSFSYNRSNTGFFGLGGYMQKLSTESEAFNKKFEIYAEDPHEAFYILTPHMMEYLTSTTHQIEGDIMFCFVGNKLHVALNNGRNAFEPRMMASDDGNAIQRVLDEIRETTAFVTELKLGDNIYK